MEGQDDIIPSHRLPVSPDRELLVWEKWIQIRQEETTGLGKKLHREPVDLVMNQLDKVREIKERKIVLEHAQLDKKYGVRGSLWERPPRLKQHCYCEPVYELHRTPAEVGRPAVIEHVGVPTHVLKTEMGMAGEKQRLPFTQLNADYNKYRDKRELELDEKIKKIDPFRPDIRSLVVQGIRPVKPPPKMPPVPEIVVHEATDVCEEALSGVYAIRINKTVMYKDIPGQTLIHVPTFQKDESHEVCTAWTYYFNVPMKRAGRAKLFLQNLGTVTIRYCWKKLKKVVPYVPEDVFEQVFFFNKNEDVLSPGQRKEIFFTFISNKPGIYSEFWELSMCNMSFFDSTTEKLTINLYADSLENIDMMKRKIEVLKTRINRKAVDNFATEFVNEIFDNVFAVPPEIYPYKKFFLEAEIFVMKNPVCFYHQTEVSKMKEYYTEMVPGELWDLSIGTWREQMMAKEFDDRMKYYELLRKSHTEFLKPWYEGEDLKKEKHRAIKCLLGQFINNFDKEFINVTDSFVHQQQPVGSTTARTKSKSKTIAIDPFTAQMVRNIMYIRLFEHFKKTIELCAGVLSSLDLNKWIEFDFCRHFD